MSQSSPSTLRQGLLHSRLPGPWAPCASHPLSSKIPFPWSMSHLAEAACLLPASNLPANFRAQLGLLHWSRAAMSHPYSRGLQELQGLPSNPLKVPFFLSKATCSLALSPAPKSLPIQFTPSASLPFSLCKCSTSGPAPVSLSIRLLSHPSCGSCAMGHHPSSLEDTPLLLCPIPCNFSLIPLAEMTMGKDTGHHHSFTVTFSLYPNLSAAWRS